VKWLSTLLLLIVCRSPLFWQHYDIKLVLRHTSSHAHVLSRPQISRRYTINNAADRDSTLPASAVHNVILTQTMSAVITMNVNDGTNHTLNCRLRRPWVDCLAAREPKQCQLVPWITQCTHVCYTAQQCCSSLLQLHCVVKISIDINEIKHNYKSTTTKKPTKLNNELSWARVFSPAKVQNTEHSRVVNKTYDAETETRPRRQSLKTKTRPRLWSDETETRPRHWSDGLETRPRRQCHQSEKRRSKQRLETFGRDVQAVTSH